MSRLLRHIGKPLYIDKKGGKHDDDRYDDVEKRLPEFPGLRFRLFILGFELFHFFLFRGSRRRLLGDRCVLNSFKDRRIDAEELRVPPGKKHKILPRRELFRLTRLDGLEIMGHDLGAFLGLFQRLVFFAPRRRQDSAYFFELVSHIYSNTSAANFSRAAIGRPTTLSMFPSTLSTKNPPIPCMP